MKDCTSSTACQHCGGRHHQSICFGTIQHVQPPRPPTKELGQINKEERGASGGTITAISSTKAKGSILLQTATTIATNKDGFRSLPVKILFDNGSQRSYVTDNLKSKLCLKPMSSETLHLNTFGENVY